MSESPWGSPKTSLFLVVVLLAVMAILAGGAARHESIAIDEFAHAGAGLSYWQKLDMRLNEEHPPLSKLIAALPLAVKGTHADYSSVPWTFSGGKLFNQYLGEWSFGHFVLLEWNAPRSTIGWARVAMLGLTLLFGYVTFSLGTRLGGQWGGLLCLACFVTTPAFLTFGPLVVTDMAIALFWVLTVWRMPDLWRSPDRKKLVLFGLALAGALLSKFSSGLLFIAFLGVAFSMRISPLPEQPAEKLARRKWRRRAWWNLAKGTAWACLFLYLVYLIFSWNQPTDIFSQIPHFPASPALRRLLMPLAGYLKGLAGFALGATSRPTFLLGHSYPHGVWFYFPVIFALKSQLSFLLLLLLAIGAAIWKRRTTQPLRQDPAIPQELKLQWRCLWVSLAVYVVACMLNRLDISVRHFSIAIALIILLLAPLPNLLRSIRRTRPRLAEAGAILSCLLVLTSFASAVKAYPNYMPYINALGFGQPAFWLVNDSNVDWDLAFPAVDEFAKKHAISPVRMDRYGFDDPSPYISNLQLWNCQTPAASDAGQWVIVSANNIYDARNCEWLLQYRHEPIGEGSMYAFHLPDAIPPAGDPGGPPLQKDWHYFAGGIMPFDARDMFYPVIRDPNQLQPTFDRIMEIGRQMREAQRKKQQ